MSGAVPLIDREMERARFEQILEDGRSVRLVTIQDEPGNGKSRLLEEFHRVCGWEREIPASLTVVSIETLRSPFDLVKLVTDGFGANRFRRFRALDRARLARNFDAFGAEISGRAYVGGSVSGSAVVAGRIGVVAQPGSHVSVGAPEWSDEHERMAHEECVGVFLDELRELARERPVVILFDEFEGCAVDNVRRWIVDDFLRNHLADEQPSQLIVVIAGREVPDLRANLGRRHDELVYAIPSLSKWTRDHIVGFLTEMTGETPAPPAVDFVEMLLSKNGEPIEKIVNIVEAWRS